MDHGSFDKKQFDENDSNKDKGRKIHEWREKYEKDCVDKNITPMNSRTRYRLKKARLRVYERIRNLVYDLHCHIVKWLCENYTFILLPTFDTNEMVKKSKRRKLSKKNTRMLLTYSFYQFKQRLISKAREYPWVKIILCNEDYTSKTCTRCGYLYDQLGGKKIYNCPSCGLRIDRDFAGARNIFIKYLTEQQSKRHN